MNLFTVLLFINIGMMASGSKLLITTTKHNERLTHAYCYLNQLKLSEKRLRLQKRTTRCPHIYFTLQSAFHNYTKPYLKTSQTHSAARSHSPAPHKISRLLFQTRNLGNPSSGVKSLNWKRIMS